MEARPSSIPDIPKPPAGRSFKLWEYRVSHKQLLIRCPKATNAESNIDVMFFNVQYIDLPTSFPDLQLDLPTRDEAVRLREHVEALAEGQIVFAIKTNHRRHLVVAGAVKVCTTKMGIFESPFKLPPVELPPVLKN